MIHMKLRARTLKELKDAIEAIEHFGVDLESVYTEIVGGEMIESIALRSRELTDKSTVFEAIILRSDSTRPADETPNPHVYQAGTRLSNAYTAGLDGKPCPNAYRLKSSASYTAYLRGKADRAKGGTNVKR